MTQSKEKKEAVIKTLDDCIEALKKRTKRINKDNVKKIKEVPKQVA